MPKHTARRHPKRSPTHPGALIGDLLDQLGSTVSYTARALDVPRHRLAAIIDERHPVTAEMALRLGKAFGDGAEVWLRMQTAYDLWHAARKVELGKVAKLRPVKRQSRLTKALLETASDMRRAGIMDEPTHRKIVKRLGGGAGQAKRPAGGR